MKQCSINTNDPQKEKNKIIIISYYVFFSVFPCTLKRTQISLSLWEFVIFLVITDKSPSGQANKQWAKREMVYSQMSGLPHCPGCYSNVDKWPRNCIEVTKQVIKLQLKS